jgi:hypothetical protein
MTITSDEELLVTRTRILVTLSLVMISGWAADEEHEHER